MQFLMDENIDGRLFKALRRQRPETAIIRVQAVGLSTTPDSDILEWAAVNNYIVVTADVNTMIADAYDRVRRGQHMPGLLAIPSSANLNIAIDSLLDVIDFALESELDSQVRYIPLNL